MNIWYKIRWFFLLRKLRTRGDTACQTNARRHFKDYKEDGYTVRYGHGWYENSPHMWCEYLQNGKWLLAMDTVYNYGGKTIGEYGGYRVKWYSTPRRKK